MEEPLLKIAEIFLLSNTILVGALGVARTEPLKTGISILGLLTTGAWLVCGVDARHDSLLYLRIIAWLPLLFLLCWIIALVVHALLWKQRASTPDTETTKTIQVQLAPHQTLSYPVEPDKNYTIEIENGKVKFSATK